MRLCDKLQLFSPSGFVEQCLHHHRHHSRRHPPLITIVVISSSSLWSSSLSLLLVAIVRYIYDRCSIDDLAHSLPHPRCHFAGSAPPTPRKPENIPTVTPANADKLKCCGHLKLHQISIFNFGVYIKIEILGQYKFQFCTKPETHKFRVYVKLENPGR